MIEVLIKSLIPILLLTIAEVLFFFFIAVKDIQTSFDMKIDSTIDSNESDFKKLNRFMLDVISIVNERLLICGNKNRDYHNSRLVWRAMALIFVLLLIIVLLYMKMDLQISTSEWWIATIIESVILLSLLLFFQFKFLNNIVKNPKYVHFTDSEIKYDLYKKLKEAKPTL